MKGIFCLFIIGLSYSSGAQVTPVLPDSIPVNRLPLYTANGIVVSMHEINADFVSSLQVERSATVSHERTCLTRNGKIVLTTDQRFDVITPKEYGNRKKFPASVTARVYKLNGCLVSEDLPISKAAIRKSEVLLSSDDASIPAGTACLSLWTLTEEERGIKRKGIRIRGSEQEERLGLQNR